MQTGKCHPYVNFIVCMNFKICDQTNSNPNLVYVKVRERSLSPSVRKILQNYSNLCLVFQQNVFKTRQL